MTSKTTSDIVELAKPIKLLLLDVDGILSDGKIYYTNNGDEIKNFHIHDGLGLKLLQKNNIEVGIITGRLSNIVKRRAEELGINLILQGREDKKQALLEVLQQQQISKEQVAYMGDDLPDLSAIIYAGLGLSVANAQTVVKEHADWVSSLNGGNGAVREACEFILNAQGKLESSIQPYFD